MKNPIKENSEACHQPTNVFITSRENLTKERFSFKGKKGDYSFIIASNGYKTVGTKGTYGLGVKSKKRIPLSS